MTFTENDFLDLVPSCCEIGLADISDFTDEEQNELSRFLPDVKSLIIVGHHIKESLEWVWFPFGTERNNSTCAADLHVKSVIEKIDYFLKIKGYNNCIAPYPGGCGLNFKTIAERTGMGEIGASYLFLHREWGPWIHLRVLLSEAEIERKKVKRKGICLNCNKCIEACPGNAIGENTFNGLKCNEKQLAEGKRLGMKGYLYKCEICARVCPIGQVPGKIDIKRTE